VGWFAAEKINMSSSEDYTKEKGKTLDVFKICGDDDNNWSYFEKLIAHWFNHQV